MLLERKHCFEKRCKGKHNFGNFQIKSKKNRTFAAKIRKSKWKLRKQNSP